MDAGPQPAGLSRDELRKRGQGPATATTAADWLPAYLGDRAQAANQGLDSDGFRRLLEDGEALILLDGLDEAPDPRRRAEVVTLIEAVARAYRGWPLVVTSRPAAYRDKAVLSGFSHSTIEALDQNAIHGFLTRWSQALFPNQPSQAEAHRQALQAALEARREIRRMARNTVMLTPGHRGRIRRVCRRRRLSGRAVVAGRRFRRHRGTRGLGAAAGAPQPPGHRGLLVRGGRLLCLVERPPEPAARGQGRDSLPGRP